MMNQLIQGLNSAVEKKSEADFFRVATKISRKYASYYAFRKESSTTEDWELIADDAALEVLELVKKTGWSHTPNYYFSCIRNRCRWLHLAYMANHKNEVSLEQITTNSDGEDFSSSCDLKTVQHERTYNEEVELAAVHKIMELADDFKSREEVEAESGIEHKIFLRLIRVWNIQFSYKYTRNFLDYMRVYNYYESVEEDLSLTRQFFKGTKLPFRVKTCISLAKHYLEVFKNNRDAFMNRFILPPNRSSSVSKIV